MGAAPVVWQRLLAGRAGHSVCSATVPDVLPVLPLRGAMMFPGAVLPLELSAAATQQLLEVTSVGDPLVLVVPQHGAAGAPSAADLYPTGVVARVTEAEGTDVCRVLLHGLERREIVSFVEGGSALRASTRPCPTELLNPEKSDELTRTLRVLAMRVARRSPALFDKAGETIASAEDPEQLTDFVIANADLSLEEKHRILATPELQIRMLAAREALEGILERAGPSPVEPECLAHGAVAIGTCGRCGTFACAACFGPSTSTRCRACRLKEKAAPVPVDGRTRTVVNVGLWVAAFLVMWIGARHRTFAVAVMAFAVLLVPVSIGIAIWNARKGPHHRKPALIQLGLHLGLVAVAAFRLFRW